MSIITIGIDLAKTIFAVHGVNESGQAELVKPKLARDQLLPLPQMRFVPIKDEHQQATFTLHHIHKGFIEERTALS